MVSISGLVDFRQGELRDFICTFVISALPCTSADCISRCAFVHPFPTPVPFPSRSQKRARHPCQPEARNRPPHVSPSPPGTLPVAPQAGREAREPARAGDSAGRGPGPLLRPSTSRRPRSETRMTLLSFGEDKWLCPLGYILSGLVPHVNTFTLTWKLRDLSVGFSSWVSAAPGSAANRGAGSGLWSQPLGKQPQPL